MSLAIIGGTGLCRLPGAALTEDRVTTRWGTVTVFGGTVGGRAVIFLPRHGGGHTVPPHAIDYRANIAALKALGVTAILASSAVGTLTPRIPPGSLALLTDFIDLTSGRACSFFETEVVHLDFTEPYSPALRLALREAADRLGIALVDEAVYAATNGPRFETPAEIRAMALLGCDLVGMTNVPEVILAREAEIPYAAVAIACNLAAGLSGERLTHSEVEETMAARTGEVARLLADVAAHYVGVDCASRRALDEYRRRRGEPDFGIPL